MSSKSDSVGTDEDAISKAPAVAYMALLGLALPVPLLHHYHTDGVIETMRPMIKLNDGHWSPLLMPIHILFLRWLGQLSWGLPCAILLLLVLSFRQKSLRRWATVCEVAIFQCAFTTFYGFYATWLLGSQWLEWTHRPA